MLITNSGLTKYEGFINGIPVFVFSDSKQSEKIDKIFTIKTKQIHFSYLKNSNKDILSLKKNFDKRFNFKIIDKNIISNNINNIRNFFFND